MWVKYNVFYNVIIKIYIIECIMIFVSRNYLKNKVKFLWEWCFIIYIFYMKCVIFWFDEVFDIGYK